MSADWYARKLGRQASQQRPQPQQYVPNPNQPPPGYIPVVPTGPPPPGATTMHNFWDMMQQWRGGKAHKIDADPCPQCGSQNYYSRTGEGPRRGPPPAPHCFACGYNGLFEQGLMSTWQT